jgi:glutathione peroxidase
VTTESSSAHAFSFPAIDGGSTLRLADFKGRPVLIVNTASECGYTPQYAGLEELWLRYRDRGLVVLGVPANDFGAQEPGSEAVIQSFCRTSYGVDFPMTAKQTVIGGTAHPFYRWVVAEFGEAAAPRWNFHKYLVAPDGSLAALWPADVEPLAPEITEAVEAALKA